jgi:hypothetical protein
MLDRERIEWARNDSDDPWRVGDSVLYRLCREQPAHSDQAAVVAKLWLVGRAYAAPIERRSKKTEPGTLTLGSYYCAAADAVIDSNLDGRLELLRARTAAELEDFETSIQIHALLLTALKRVSGTAHRSFVSKYLHFHVPDWFFILDAVASRGLRVECGRQRPPKHLAPGGDPEYRSFVGRAWQLRERLAADAPPRLTLRQLDRLLLRSGAP